MSSNRDSQRGAGLQRADLKQRGCRSQLLPRPHFGLIPGVTERLQNPGLLLAFLLQSNDFGFICDGDPGWGLDLSKLFLEAAGPWLPVLPSWPPVLAVARPHHGTR